MGESFPNRRDDGKRAMVARREEVGYTHSAYTSSADFGEERGQQAWPTIRHRAKRSTKISSSATPAKIGSGPNGSPGNWKRQVIVRSYKRGISLLVEISY